MPHEGSWSPASPLRIGLLDAVPEEYYLPGEKTDPEKFIDMFEGIGAPLTFRTYRITSGEFPATLDECAAYLITGSPCSVYDTYEWIPRTEALIRALHERRSPLVGVCFGHQLIAEALGGAVELADNGWLLGVHDIEVAAAEHWMNGEADVHPLYFINQDQVVSLPEGAERLAGSRHCPNAMFRIDEHILCLQAHPEQPKASMQAFIDLLEEEYGVEKSVCDAAMASMEAREPDAVRVAGWLSRFLQTAGR